MGTFRQVEESEHLGIVTPEKRKAAEKDKTKSKTKPKNKRSVCFCGHPSCRIGHFIEVKE
jgi:hypothetical protein